MKTFVISLASRQQRLIWFDDQNRDKIKYEVFTAIDGSKLKYGNLVENGFNTNKNWIDPIHETHITSGEIGCFMSHYMLWEKCVLLDEPILVLEDDAVITDEFDLSEIKSLTNKYDFIYLGWNEMDESTPINDQLVVPKYPYWTLAYVVTPQAAKKLIEGNIRKNIIPVDEYLPLRMKDLNPCGYKNNVVTPVGRDKFPSDVDPVDRYSFFLDFRTHAITVGDDDSKCWRLHTSANKNDFNVRNIGSGIVWSGSDMSGPGGGQKVNILRRHLDRLPDHDVVLFMDGFDTFTASDLEEITRRYLEFKCKVLFAAERFLWPDKSLNFPPCDTPYRYLNSGLFIGRVDELKQILSEPIDDTGDDQLYYQHKFLSGNFDIKLDYECYIFQCHDFIVNVTSDDQLLNPVTSCLPCLYHGNGGDEAKDRFARLYSRVFDGETLIDEPKVEERPYINTAITYAQHHNYALINQDMLVIDYMAPSMCEEMIRIADEHGGWGSLSYDKFPAQEIRLKELGLWEMMVEHWEDVVNPIIEHHWKPMEMYGMRDAFVMRYSLETQKELALHTDASLVTGSVKLNDDYEGGELIWPRQQISNKNLPIGKCILFPGAVTHGHACTELKSGVKYSLTMWSSRYHGDVL